MGSRFSTNRLTLTMARKDRNASMPCRAEKPAYSAMLIGPLRFLTETSPVATFQSMRTVSTDMSQVLSVARTSAPSGPCRSLVRISSGSAPGGGRLHADAPDQPLALALRTRPRPAPRASRPCRSIVNARRAPGLRLHPGHQRRRSRRPARRRRRRSRHPRAARRARPDCRARSCRRRPARVDTRNRTRAPAAARRARSARAGRPRPAARRCACRRRVAQLQFDRSAIHQLVEHREHRAPRGCRSRAARPRRSRRPPAARPARPVNPAVTSPSTGFRAGTPATNSTQ